MALPYTWLRGCCAICENAEHHVAVSRSLIAGAVAEALGKYQGWDVLQHSP
jgi:hypothetical protein